MRRPWSATRCLVVPCLLLLGLGLLFTCLGQLQPVSNVSKVAVLDIFQGESFADVAQRLQAHQMIRNARAFVWMGRLGGLDRKIIPGEYEFHGGMSPVRILRKLASGEVRSYTVTIPEGFSAKQIADVLHEKRLVDREEWLRLLRDPAFIRTLSLSADTLEGYLFPDTYVLTRHMGSATIMRTMVARFKQIVTEEYRTRAAALGLSLHQVVTLASVVEKETARPDERALIAGVFHNRLRRNIPLQSDPTVIYALHDFDGNLHKKDLSIESPYNTYRVRGLPPGPITNPGEAAIRAALYPESTRYLYFVSRNDGSHEFSTTLAEHQRAVRKHQLRHRPRSS